MQAGPAQADSCASQESPAPHKAQTVRTNVASLPTCCALFPRWTPVLWGRAHPQNCAMSTVSMVTTLP